MHSMFLVDIFLSSFSIREFIDFHLTWNSAYTDDRPGVPISGRICMVAQWRTGAALFSRLSM